MTHALGHYGQDAYGDSPYGGSPNHFGLESVTVLSPTLLRVRYTALFDPAFPPLLQASNYHISPAITVYAVSTDTPQTVLLTVANIGDTVYTLTIDVARGFYGEPLDPAFASVTFLGTSSLPNIRCAATGPRRVRVIFNADMLMDAAYTSVSSYSMYDLQGNTITISSVVAEQNSPYPARSVVLVLAADMEDERWFRVTTVGVLQTLDSIIVSGTSVFQWVSNPLETMLDFRVFSGETEHPLVTDPSRPSNHAVFFSPALEDSAPDSTIQVDEIDVCVRADDVYRMPPVPTPRLLFKTHGAGVVPTPEPSLLNSPIFVLAPGPGLADGVPLLTLTTGMVSVVLPVVVTT